MGLFSWHVGLFPQNVGLFHDLWVSFDEIWVSNATRFLKESTVSIGTHVQNYIFNMTTFLQDNLNPEPWTLNPELKNTQGLCNLQDSRRDRCKTTCWIVIVLYSFFPWTKPSTINLWTFFFSTLLTPKLFLILIVLYHWTDASTRERERHTERERHYCALCGLNISHSLIVWTNSSSFLCIFETKAFSLFCILEMQRIILHRTTKPSSIIILLNHL